MPWLAGAGLALALALASIGMQPALAQAARPVVSEVRTTTTTPSSDRLVVRSETLTSSEPDYEGLDPLDESMTNPDIDTP